MKSREVALATESFPVQITAMSQDTLRALLVCAVLCFGLMCLQTVPLVNGQDLQTENNAMAARTLSGDTHPILVELFTSEGCSSCPPADAFLQEIDTSQPVAGAQLIVLSEHVDYWDHDGWRDPNSSPALTERQSAYVHTLGLTTPYTPQIIVDGTSEIRLRDLQQISKTFQEAYATVKAPVRISTLGVEAGNPTVLRMRVEADGSPDEHNADVYLVLALDHVESQVLHGENGGRHLTHVAVVQSLERIGRLEKGKNFGRDVQVKLKPRTDPTNLRVIAFVQESGPSKVLGAALRMIEK